MISLLPSLPLSLSILCLSKKLNEFESFKKDNHLIFLKAILRNLKSKTVEIKHQPRILSFIIGFTESMKPVVNQCLKKIAQTSKKGTQASHVLTTLTSHAGVKTLNE